MKNKKGKPVFALILLASLLLLVAISPNIASVKAQGNAIVNMIATAGGTTTPSGMDNTYPDGTAVTLTASPYTPDAFLYWTVATNSSSTELDQNPATLTVSGGVTYNVTAVFEVIGSLPGSTGPTSPAVGTLSTDAIVVVEAGVGGTTSPAPGTYYLANAKTTTLTATADSGWVFSHWAISGPASSHGGVPYTLTPTNNPYTVGHGYGYTYYYQAVFTPVSTTTSPTPTINEFSSAAIIVLALALVGVAFGTYTYKKRTKN